VGCPWLEGIGTCRDVKQGSLVCGHFVVRYARNVSAKVYDFLAALPDLIA
jgi:hypothetical protein